MTILIRPLLPRDRAAWEPLWAAYLEFYETILAPEVTDETWRRLFDPLESVGALGAFTGSDAEELVGFCHHLFHRSTWSLTSYCYLEDLFTAPSARGQGVARGLIDATARVATSAGANKLYWQTHTTNTTARRLYDQMAHHDGYLLYEKDL